MNIPEGFFTSGEDQESVNLTYDYSITKYEISFNQFAEFMNSLRRYDWWKFNDNKTGLIGYWDGDEFKSYGWYLFYIIDEVLSDSNSHYIYWDGEEFIVPSELGEFPVTNVTWYGAQAYAEYYGAALPTADEWEKAARGNDGRIYSWGNELDSSYGNFWSEQNSGAKPVGYYNGENGTVDAQSPYGLYDMSGNVSEWTYTSGSEAEIFGGSWADRMDTSQVWKHQTRYLEHTSNTLGFRIVRGSQVVKVSEDSSQPNQFKLDQNYPNPFNPTTTIEYSIPEMNNVQLIIYDVLGREVATLVNEVQPQGNYKVSFDGSGLASGIYYYQLITDHYDQTKKMVLLR
jgi:formylglycine-generating enzyme required for sulfatase activity